MANGGEQVRRVNGEQFVTYNNLIKIIIGIISGLVLAGGGLMSWHSTQPHVTAINRAEYVRDQDAVHKQLDRIEEKLDAALLRCRSCAIE